MRNSSCRQSGLPNFNPRDLNFQVECHPLLPQEELLKYCKEKGILLQAYSPLGGLNSPLLSDPIFKGIADNHGVKVSQILISWQSRFPLCLLESVADGLFWLLVVLLFFLNPSLQVVLKRISVLFSFLRMKFLHCRVMLRKTEGLFDLLIHVGEGILVSLMGSQKILKFLEEDSGMLSQCCFPK
jgi:hypothetical protein